MTDDPYEKKVCCERGGEEVDHYRKGAKVLADIGQDAAFMLDIPLQERSLYATEAVKRINDWPERGFFSMLGEAAVFDILKEMAESSYKPIADNAQGSSRRSGCTSRTDSASSAASARRRAGESRRSRALQR
jgi:ring-1,2-phenylacetyl-CoA epoxidase subunit PaaA